MRIASICPSNTELLGYLGLTSSLVGVDKYSDWPEAVSSLPKLGSDLKIDMDDLERLEPELVVASLTVPGMERNIEELERRKLPYIISNPSSLTDIGENLLMLGKETNTLDRAKLVYDKYHGLLNQYKAISEKVTHRPTLYWEWWAKPVYTPGATNWLTDISILAGGRNIYDTENVSSFKTTPDEVISRNPNCICVVWVGVQKDKVNPKVILSRPGWDMMDAVKKEQLFVLDEPFFCRPSPRLIVGLQQIAHILHPELYPPFIEGEDPLLQALEGLN
jgi:iron complex transport system substrate-binding protein